MYQSSLPEETVLHIQESFAEDKLNIYLISRYGNKKTYYYFENGELMATEMEMHSVSNDPIKPFLSLPSYFGRRFLSLLNDEIANKGINQKNVDMQAGKTELLQDRLKFSDDQLVKFIDFFTAKPIQPSNE